MSSLIVRPIAADEHDTWDEFVSSVPTGTLFHTSAFKRVVDRYHAPAVYELLGCFEDGRLVAGAAYLNRERFGHRTAVMPLLAPYAGYLLEAPGGKLSSQSVRQSRLLEALSAYLCREFEYEKLFYAPALEDTRALTAAGYRIAPRFSYYLNLLEHADELFEQFDSAARNKIRKAEKAGYELTDQMDDAQAFALYEGLFTRHGQRCPVSREYFLELTHGEILKDCRQVLAAWRGSELAAYAVLFRHEDTIVQLLTASSPEHAQEGINSLLVWEAVKINEGSGAAWLDFAGGNISAIARFKESFNPRLVVYYCGEHYGSTMVRVGRLVLDWLKKS